MFSDQIFALVNWWHRARPLVLLYHGASERPPANRIASAHGKQVPVANLREQLVWLKKNFTVVPLAEIERLALGDAPPREKLAAITFDDGYQNNFHIAYPVLREFNLTATFFLTGQFVDQRTPLWIDRLAYALGDDLNVYLSKRQELKKLSAAERELKLQAVESQTGRRLAFADSHPADDYAPLSWAEAREMAAGGMSFGAHTLTHPVLSRLTAAEQAKEILGAQKLIENQLGACPHFAYPNGQPGDWNNETLGLVAQAGWRAAWTTRAARLRPGRDAPLLLPRLTIAAYHSRARFRALASGLVPR